MPPLRAPEPHELDAFASAVEAAFLFRFPDDEREAFLAALDPARCLVAEVGGELVAALASHDLELTIPGPSVVVVEALTDLAVVPTQRRRGLGSALVGRFLRDAHERGTAIALLDARPGGFYRSFGFGVAGFASEYRVAAGRAALVPGAASGELHLLRPDEALEALPPIFERHRRASVGEITRTAEEWHRLLAGGKSVAPAFVVAHELGGELDGYLRYRAGATGARAAHLDELVATTAVAAVALGRAFFALGDDLLLTTGPRPVDEALRYLLRDPGALEVAALRDRSWLRLVDVPRALSRRTYAAPGELRFELDDALCPWNAGCWRLTVEAGGSGRVERARTAELALRVDALAASYLGGASFRQLALAGAVAERAPGAVARADALFAIAQVPFQGAEL